MTDATTTETAQQPSDSLIRTTESKPFDFTAGKPEGFPDEFWSEEKKSPDVDKLFTDHQRQSKIAKDLRVKLSRGEFEGKPPEDIKEYVLQLDDKLKDLVRDDDPMLMAAREAAKSAGLPKETFNKFIGPVLSKLAELKGDMEKPPTEEEMESARIEEIEKLGPTGQRIVNAVGSWIQEMQSQGTLSEADAATAKEMCYSADSARVLNKLRMRVGGRDAVPVDVPIDSKASRSDIEQKLAKAILSNNEKEAAKFTNMLNQMKVA